MTKELFTDNRVSEKQRHFGIDRLPVGNDRTHATALLNRVEMRVRNGKALHFIGSQNMNEFNGGDSLQLDRPTKTTGKGPASHTNQTSAGSNGILRKVRPINDMVVVQADTARIAVGRRIYGIYDKKIIQPIHFLLLFTDGTSSTDNQHATAHDHRNADPGGDGYLFVKYKNGGKHSEDVAETYHRIGHAERKVL